MALASPLIVSNAVIGAGGEATGIAFSNDGTRIIRCDTAVPHRRAPGASTWTREATAGGTFAEANVDITYGGSSTYAATIAPSNSAAAAMAIFGYVWFLRPGNSTYVKSALPPRSTMDGNNSYRNSGEQLLYDPINHNVCAVAVPEGTYLTQDAGVTMPAIGTGKIPLPSPVDARYIFAWDPRASQQTGGKSSRLGVFVPGTGTYVSTNAHLGAGSITFTFIGGPLVGADMQINPANGNIVLAGPNGETDGNVSVWNGSSWITGTNTSGGGNTQIHTFCFDKNVANLVHGMQGGGAYCNSLDGGLTWGELRGQYQTAATVEVPWHVRQGASGTDYRTVSKIRQDPTTGYLEIAGGITVWQMRTVPTAASLASQGAILVNSIGRGIENMVTLLAVEAPDGRSAESMQDKQIIIFDKNQAGRSFTSNYGPRVGSILRGQVPDYAPEDTSFWAGTFSGDGPATAHLGWSPDLGASWVEVQNLRAATGGNGGGQLALLSKDVAVVSQLSVQANDAAAWQSGVAGGTGVGDTRLVMYNASVRTPNAVYLTRNLRNGLSGGKSFPTWTEVPLGNGNCTVMQPTTNGIRNGMCKDPLTPGRMLIANIGDCEQGAGKADDVACRGLYVLDVPLGGSGFTLTRVYTNRIFPFSGDYYHLRIKWGGVANTYYIHGGGNTLGLFKVVLSAGASPTATVTEVTGSDSKGLGTRWGEVHGFGVGKGKGPGFPRRLHAVGFRITADFYHDPADWSRYGRWYSDDDGANWQFAEKFPGGIFPGGLNALNDMNASMAGLDSLRMTTDGKGSVSQYRDYRLLTL